jgi:hypothetical protein
MESDGISAKVKADAIEADRDQTRRGLLGKGAALAGGIGAVSLLRPEPALAVDGFDGFNNVKDFPSIQSAIDASAGRATVYFPPGTYVTDTPIALRSGTVLVGHGSLTVIKASASLTGSLFHTEELAVDDVLLENLTLDGNRANRTTRSPVSNNLIRIAGPKDAVSNRIYVRNVKAHDNIVGFVILFLSVHTGAIEGCHVFDSGKDGIHLQGNCQRILVQGNVVQNCEDDQIAVGRIAGFSSTGAMGISIVGNFCDATGADCGSAIAIRGGGGVLIDGNVCYNGRRAAVEITTGDPTNVTDSTDVVVSNNFLRDLRDTVLPSSQCSQGGVAGIVVHNGSGNGSKIERLVLSGNVIRDPIGHGVRLIAVPNSSVTDVEVSGNVIANPRTRSGVTPAPAPSSGIASLSPAGSIADVLVTANRIRDADGPGVTVVGSNNRRWELRDNVVLNSGALAASPGIHINGAVEFSVVGNRSQPGGGTTQTYGLQIDNPPSSGDVLVTNNCLSGNPSGAIKPSSGLPGNIHVFENTGASAQGDPLP